MLVRKIRSKKTKSFVFLHGAIAAAYDKIPVAGKKIVDGLNRFIEKRKIEVTGPLIWSYKPFKGKLKLRAGFPVKKGTRGREPFAAKTEPTWKSISAEYKGSMAHMFEAWEDFFAAIQRKGLTCHGDRREIYRKWVGFYSKDNITELQIRLKKCKTPPIP